jgi:hypothetical protein
MEWQLAGLRGLDSVIIWEQDFWSKGVAWTRERTEQSCYWSQFDWQSQNSEGYSKVRVTILWLLFIVANHSDW